MFILIFIFQSLSLLQAQDQSSGAEKRVRVENPYYSVSETQTKNKKYREIRPAWGFRLTFLGNNAEAVNANLVRKETELGAELSINRNFHYFSLGLEGFIQNASWKNDAENSISQLRFGGGLVAHLDGLFSRAYVVPYASFGLVQINAKIEDEIIETEKMIFYQRVGVLFSLNWLDSKSAWLAYEDFGLLNSSIYLGARKIFTTNEVEELDLATNYSLEFGFQLEF